MEIVQVRDRKSRYSVAILSLFLVLALLLSALPQSQAAAVTCKYKHKVQAGETLTYIGYLYTVNWLDIADANNIGEPYVIAAGQVLCIPYGTEPANTTTSKKGKEPKVDIVVNLLRVLVAVENFPKKTSYYVKIFPAGSSVSYHLGHFTTNKEGDFTGWFKISPSIPHTSKVRLCIKNVWTDAVTCITYTDPYIYPVYLYPKCRNSREPR
jgi:hypothetical protein